MEVRVCQFLNSFVHGVLSADDTSAAYHMWVMIGTYNYFLFSNDTGFLTQNWPRYLKAMEYLDSRMEAEGILNCSGRGDWGRHMSVNNGSAASMM